MHSILLNGKNGLAGALVAACLAAGCASVEQPLQSNLASASAEIADCARWFSTLDATVERAGVRDAGAYRIPGFPYLRADRFSASFRHEVKGRDQAFDEWVGRLAQLDAAARSIELDNLPASDLAGLGAGNSGAARTRMEGCRTRLLRADLASPSQRELLIARAGVPDDYSGLKRALGVYPLAIIPFARGVESWQKEVHEMFRLASSGEAGAGTITRYAPAGKAATAQQITSIVSQAGTDALGIPRFDSQEREMLLQAFAPVFEVETGGEHDRPGALQWRNGPAPEVDMTRPVAYRRLAFTRYHGSTLVQLVYTVWFSERPESSAVDMLAGRLDGVVFRVTLDTRGRPLVYDTMHPCGCYHLFFPTARVKALPSPEPGIEWALVPRTLPALNDSPRLAVRIQSGTHYVVDVHSELGGDALVYQFAEDDSLRSLPGADGRTRSAFGPDGIVPGTERMERFAFWPMGIENAGAMRQWGRHATAFIGRRHFDDADLIERRFEILPPGPVNPVGR